MGVLFDCSTDNVGLHLKNIYANGELSKEATTEEFSVVQKIVLLVQHNFANGQQVLYYVSLQLEDILLIRNVWRTVRS